MTRKARRRCALIEREKAVLALHAALLREIEEAMNDNGGCNLRRISYAVSEFEKVWWPI